MRRPGWWAVQSPRQLHTNRFWAAIDLIASCCGGHVDFVGVLCIERCGLGLRF